MMPRFPSKVTFGRRGVCCAVNTSGIPVCVFLNPADTSLAVALISNRNSS